MCHYLSIVVNNKGAVRVRAGECQHGRIFILYVLGSWFSSMMDTLSNLLTKKISDDSDYGNPVIKGMGATAHSVSDQLIINFYIFQYAGEYFTYQT